MKIGKFKTQFIGVLGQLVALTAAGCVGVNEPTDQSSESGVTQQMRDACPMLSEEVLEGFVLAVAGLRDDGLGEADALVLWVEGCEDIPPDGNFQGDVEACRECMPVIVEDVYAE